MSKKEKNLHDDLEKLLDKKDKLEEIEASTYIPRSDQKLKEISPQSPSILKKEDIKKETKHLIKKIQELQRIMYAQGKYSLLIILQGMDASGKDSTVRKIFTGVNPLWCRVHSFKAPTHEELSHDYLWRIHKETPANGMIQIFNRSQYEDILVPTVDELFPSEVIAKRYTDINNFEQLLTDNNTVVVKFYLHISHKKQIEKLNERLEEPEKYRKHNDGDRNSSEKFDKYLEVYDEIFQKCNIVPRHIIPSNDKWYKVYLVAKAIVDALESMDLKWPKLETEME